MSDEAPPLLYAELARWWHVMSDPADYEEEAEIFSAALEEAARREIGTVLEMGCGGGNNACHLKHRYRMTLSDLSAGMLEASRRLNPDCEHFPGDMRTLGLSREFDAVFVHDALSVQPKHGIREPLVPFEETVFKDVWMSAETPSTDEGFQMHVTEPDDS